MEALIYGHFPLYESMRSVYWLKYKAAKTDHIDSFITKRAGKDKLYYEESIQRIYKPSIRKR